MSPFLTAPERRALARCLRMLEVPRGRLALSLLLGSAALASSIALGATAAWLIARASQQPPVLYLTVAATSVRLFGVSRAVLRYLQRLASHRVALGGMDALRRNLYDALAASRSDHLASLRRGDLMARTGAEVDEVGNLLVRTVLPVGVSAIVGVGTAVAIALVSPAAGLVLAVCLLVSGVAAPALTARSVRVAEEDSASARIDLSASALTLMDGATELRVNGRVAPVRQALEDAEDRLAAAAARSARLAAAASAVDALATGAAVVGAALIGTAQTASGHLPAVMLAVLVLTPLSSFEGVAELAPAAAQLVRSAGAAQRICEVLGPRAPAPTTRVPGPGPEGPVLEARDLAVGWPGGPVVAEGISLALRPGRTLAVVGPSGIGKTTLLMTLAGMLEPKAGTVRINGADAWSSPRSDVTRNVCATAEDAHVFATTVLENLRAANPALEPEGALRLLRAVGLGDWVAALPDGVDTRIGSGATTVSGGERRRLLMARALASPAPLMLVDEASEHLDPSTADALVGTLFDQGAGRGTLLVTHRLAGAARADSVLVLGPGPGPAARVVDNAPYSEIIARRPDLAWAAGQEEA